MLPRIQSATSTSATVPGSLTTLRQDATRVVIRAVGEWDLANAPVLADVLDEHRKAGRHFVRLDLSAVSFLDCTCLDVLVTAHERLLAAQGTLMLTGVTPPLRRLLSLARLDQVLLATSLSDADARSRHAAAGRAHRVVRPITKPA